MNNDLTRLEQLNFSLIKIWESSGKTQRAFCQEKDLSYAKFYYWFKKYREHFPPSSPDSPFVSVTVKKEATEPTSPSGVFLELIYPDGHRLIFNQAVKAGFLKALLS